MYQLQLVMVALTRFVACVLPWSGIDVERYRDYVLSLDDHFHDGRKENFFESAMVAGKILAG